MVNRRLGWLAALLLAVAYGLPAHAALLQDVKSDATTLGHQVAGDAKQLAAQTKHESKGSWARMKDSWSELSDGIAHTWHGFWGDAKQSGQQAGAAAASTGRELKDRTLKSGQEIKKSVEKVFK